jgi:hypothetical protein
VTQELKRRAAVSTMGKEGVALGEGYYRDHDDATPGPPAKISATPMGPPWPILFDRPIGRRATALRTISEGAALLREKRSVATCRGSLRRYDPLVRGECQAA